MSTFPSVPGLGAGQKEILEYPSLGNLPAIGYSGRLYVTTDSGAVYRWTGSAYAAVTSSGSVVQAANLAGFPTTGASSTLYIAADTGFVYRWNGSSYTQIGGAGVSDHGALTGLTDDDHPQYLTQARGDARYPLLGHTHTLAGLTDVNLTGASDGQVLKRVGGIWVPAADLSGGGGGGMSDGDYGDVTVSGGGSVITLDDGTVTPSKLSGAFSAAGKNLITAADSAAQRALLGLGSAALVASSSFETAGATATHAALSTAHGISAFGSALVGAADAATARATLGVSDTFLLDRANHTGTQASATISDFAESVDDRVASLLVAGANVTLTYNDAANTLTIASLGGGGGGSLADGSYGDVVVSGSGTVITINNATVTLAKLANVATGTLLGRTTAGTGSLESLTASQARTLLGLVIGTDVQAYAANLAALAGVTGAADKLFHFTGPGTGVLVDFTAAGRALVGAANAAAQRTALGVVIGTDVQPYDTELTALAGLTSAANQLPYFTGSGTAALTTLSAYARTLLDDADAATARTTLGLGSMATAAAPAGAVVGTTDAQTLTNKTLTAPVIATIVNTGTLTLPTSTDTLVGRATTDTLTNKTLSAPVLTGIWRTDGAQVTTANAMGALAIDTTKGLNTKSIAADSTFTFSGAPATANTWFSMRVTNTDTNLHTLTIPSSISMARGATVTTVTIRPSSTMLLTWLYDGTNYYLFTADGFLSKWDATSAPGASDDVTKGYGPGSLILDATANIPYLAESTGAAAAVWHQLVVTNSVQTLSNKTTQLDALPATNNTYQGNVVAGRNAGATIAQWGVVYLDASGTWQLADANGSGTFPARGLAVAGYSSGNAAVVLVDGVARNDAWAWTVGGDVYLSTTAGGLTQTAPATAGDKVQVIGWALTADSIRVCPSQTYLTRA